VPLCHPCIRESYHFTARGASSSPKGRGLVKRLAARPCVREQKVIWRWTARQSLGRVRIPPRRRSAAAHLSLSPNNGLAAAGCDVPCGCRAVSNEATPMRGTAAAHS
jgi:hypothetical protein